MNASVAQVGGVAPSDPDRIGPGFERVIAARRLVGQPDPERIRRDPAAARASLKRLAALFGPSPDPEVRIERGPSLGPVGRVDLVPMRAPLRAGRVIYVHGGGLVVYDLETFLPTLTRLAAASGRVVTAIDYPKVPEVAPARAVAGVLEALERLGAEAGDGPDPLVLAGDSIGGLLVLLAASGPLAGLRPAVVPIYPVLDLTEDRAHPSRERFGRGYFLDEPVMAWFRSLAREALPGGFDPLGWPLETWERMGAVHIVAAPCDVLSDEGAAFAAAAPPGRVRRTVLPGLPHDFLLFAGRVPEAARGLARVAAILADPAVPSAMED